jgi:hypothetical protein
MHTTNYYDTFIQIADDSPATSAEIPAVKGDNKTIANIQFDMLIDEPYKYTSDDVVFGTYARKNGISKSKEAEEREAFFSKGQPCLRASPLTKRYGWGIHSNAEGKVAIYAAGTGEYTRLAADSNLKQLKAMRSKRA